MASDSEVSADRASERDDEISLLGVLLFLSKRKITIALVTFSFFVASVVASLFLPNIYTATVRILPPQQSQSTGVMLLNQLSGLANIAGSSIGLKNPNELYVGILKSRTVADNIIRSFALESVYGKDTLVETREALAEKSSIAAGKDGIIVVDFDDQDPQRAASIANAYVEELKELTQSIAVTEAAQRRLFFERQLQQVQRELAQAEVALKQTQEKTGLIQLDSQGKAIIESVASFRARIAVKKVELHSMGAFTTPNNPEYVRAQRELAGLEDQLTQLEQAEGSGGKRTLMSTQGVPEAGLEYVRRLREVKYQEAIFDLLARQYEVAKVDEAKETGLIQVIDHAVVPDRKSKPRRTVIVVLSTLLGGVVGVLVALALEVRARLESDPRYAGQWAELRRNFGL